MDEAHEMILSNPFDRWELITKINDDPALFKTFIEKALSDDQPHAWRAAWILGHCTSANDQRLVPYTERMVQSIPGRKDGHQRELLKLLQKVDLDDDLEGWLFDHCMSIWEAIGKTPSVRIVAFRMLAKIAGKYPELVHELSILTQNEYTETLSPGVKRSLKKIAENLQSGTDE